MADQLQSAPVLSTPDTHIFEEPAPSIPQNSRVSEEQLLVTYEIEQTLNEIKRGRWRRVALQFPDDMLPDAPRVFEALSRGLNSASEEKPVEESIQENAPKGDEAEPLEIDVSKMALSAEEMSQETKLYILADTSYGSCCVDEIAAEHVDADVVVHYGRACLSPTARLPVIHVFTRQELSFEHLLQAFRQTHPERDKKIILTADVTYHHYVPRVYEALRHEGYTNLFCAEIIHNPSSPVPNRTVPGEVMKDAESLRDWDVFHISDPPDSLLLSLSSRTSSIHIYPTESSSTSQAPLKVSTALNLRRRYALLTSLNTASIFGILINTLSVKNYIHIVDHVKAQIAAAGKKSYTFVVGKVNAAKVANFSEIGGWVVIGCWESSLVESKDFWKPVITPFELELALKKDSERIWTGEWRSDFQKILDDEDARQVAVANGQIPNEFTDGADPATADNDELDSDEESAPPEFDLRTGRYVSHTRPMAASAPKANKAAAAGPKASSSSTALARRARGDLATVGGTVSPAAEYLRSQRTWQGLGSDFTIAYEDDESHQVETNGSAVEQGRSGIARGYKVDGATEGK